MTDIHLPTRDEIQARKLRLWGRVPVAKVEAKPEPVPIAPKRKRERLSPEMKILQRIADKHDVSVGEILGRDKARSINNARFEAAYTLMSLPGMSYRKVGRILRRDATSVVNAIRMHAKRNQAPVIDRSVPEGQRGWNLAKYTPRHEAAA